MRVRRRSKRILYVGLGLFVAVFLFSFLMQKFKGDGVVDAASLAGFDPGYIISDWQMGNYNSMNEAEIQAFLTAKNPCGNRDYGLYQSMASSYPSIKWHWDNGHFICISEERFGDGEMIGSGDTAAHIIWQAAQDYRINPQVLIVLLQKEQGLITDDFPNSKQYRSATGYGCPDTAPCSMQYYGFKNQVRKAAAMFRTVLDGGWTNYPLGNNYIQYNPNAGCGGSVVNIRSLATSALYRYTPYQPNAGALAAGYGTAYCGAYGNRNFYLYFEDWFGGVTTSDVVWVAMKNPRVMTARRPTLVIDANEQKTTNEWIEERENYYFTKKASVFWGDRQQVCLQRKIDEGTNRCVLMDRLEDYLFEKDGVLLQGKEYVIREWTCAVDIIQQDARCGEREYYVNDVISAEKLVVIDNKEYLIMDNGYGVLRTRAKQKVDFELIGPVLMKLRRDSYKYNIESGERVQILTTEENKYIKIMDRCIIDNELYYRTAHDYDKNFELLIPAADLDDNILVGFMYPRNLEFINDASSFNLDTNNGCTSYKQKMITRFVNKIDYNGESYYQADNEKNTKCVVKAADLQETKYNLQISESGGDFVGFLYPRRMVIKSATFMIDVRNGKTCDVFLGVGNTQEYVTKIGVDGIVFYRTKYKTETNSFCAVPASSLKEAS